MNWLKHKYIAFQLMIAAMVMHDMEEAMTQALVLLGEDV